MNQVQPCLPCLGDSYVLCLLYLTKLPLFSFDDFQFMSAIFVGLITVFSDGTFNTHCLDVQAG